MTYEVIDDYQAVVDKFIEGDETFLLGFSRGGLAARAFGGLLKWGSTIKPESTDRFDEVWQ